MLKNYLRVFIRNLIRQKGTSLTNLAGVSIGISCFLFIGLYVADEWSVDRFHEKGQRLYRVITNATFNGATEQWGFAPNKVATTALAEIPEVEQAARILEHNFSGQAFVANGEVRFLEKRFVWADSTLFDLIHYEFIEGGIKPLSRPNTVVVDASTARKYFNSTDVLGKTLKVDNTHELEIVGVFRDQSSHTVFDYPIIASFQSSWAGAKDRQSWGNASFNTLLLLNENARQSDVEKKLQEMIDRNVEKADQYFTLSLVPLSDNYLYTTTVTENNNAPKGDISQVKTMIALACIVLLIAMINYVNMTTAQAQRRQKEIGINKTLGATRGLIARRFYFETSAFVLTALLIGLLLTIILLPALNELSGKQLTTEFISEPLFWAGFFLLWLIVSVIAGVYPSLYLSSFTPKQSLKSASPGGAGTFRKVLIVTQFATSIVLIIGTVVLLQQMHYIRDKKLGFEPEQVVAILASGAQHAEQVEAFQNRVAQLKDVVVASRAQSYPGAGGSGRTLAPISGDSEPIALTTVKASPEIVQTLSLNLLAGHSLPEKAKSDTTIQVILNKTATDFLGLSPEEAIGQKVNIFYANPAEIVGVVEDFHYESLHSPIGAYCFHNAPHSESLNYVLVKLDTKRLATTMADIETEFKKIIPSAFDYTFLDSHLDSMYRAENRLLKVVLIFSVISIFLACLGLYALTSFTVDQRIREIGIRKVLGASVLQLSNMLSRDFLVLVLIGVAVSIPVSYYFIDQWLQNFHYHVKIQVLTFVISTLGAVAIASLTVGLKTIKAASSNPVDSLRND